MVPCGFDVVQMVGFTTVYWFTAMLVDSTRSFLGICRILPVLVLKLSDLFGWTGVDIPVKDKSELVSCRESHAFLREVIFYLFFGDLFGPSGTSQSGNEREPNTEPSRV